MYQMIVINNFEIRIKHPDKLSFHNIIYKRKINKKKLLLVILIICPSTLQLEDLN